MKYEFSLFLGIVAALMMSCSALSRATRTDAVLIDGATIRILKATFLVAEKDMAVYVERDQKLTPELRAAKRNVYREIEKYLTRLELDTAP